MVLVDGVAAACTFAVEMIQGIAVVFAAKAGPKRRRMDGQLDKVEEDDDLLALSGRE